MKKAIFTITIMLFAIAAQAQQHPAIKVHSDGQVSLQSSATTNGVQVRPDGFASFEPNFTASYSRTAQTSVKNRFSRCWIVRNPLPIMPISGDVFYVTGLGSTYCYSYYTISNPDVRSGAPIPIENASEKISNLKGYYFENHEFDGFENDFENNENILPEAIPGLVSDLKKDKSIGLLAKELEEVVPESVRHDPEGNLYINYNALTTVLIEAVKEQQKEIKELRALVKEITGRHLDGLPAGVDGQANGHTGTGKTKLYQNRPNPFSNSTSIDYYLDENVKDASMLVFNMQGGLVKGYDLSDHGAGTVTINSSDLPAGMYYYSLVANGQEIETLKMILSK